MLKIKNKELQSYESNLKRIRVSMGITQSELATLSGINIKNISAYEQKPERINKASLETVYNISNCLGCNIEDLLQVEFVSKKSG